MERALMLASCLCLLGTVRAGDWPQWGGRPCRNMVSYEKHLPASFDPGQHKSGSSQPETSTARNVKWAARLGTETYGNPTISGGKVFVGTNNGAPRDPRLKGDRHVLMCFEEATGRFLWQLVAPKLRQVSNFNGDFRGLGVTSSPTVEGDRVYIVTSRCDVLCLDVHGLANGNDGPFTDEGRLIAARVVDKVGKPPRGRPPVKDPLKDIKPLPLKPTDADVVWRYDMIAGLDIWPQDNCDSSTLIRGDLLYVCTSNGVDKGHKVLPCPDAPTLIALDKRTGKLVAVDDAGIGHGTFHGNWSSPSLATVNGRDLVLLGGGDGFCYAFDAEPAEVPGKKVKVLRTAWKCDANPPEYRERNGKRLPYNKNHEGPSELTGTPVFCHNRVYTTVGQDTRHGPGPGCLTCMDATKTGDISKTGVLWRYKKLNRSLATPSVADGLVFVADVVGDIHCLDARTGKLYWVHHTGGQMMGSTLVADGKVYAGNKSGKLTVLAAGKEKKLLAEVRLRAPMHCTPVAANGVLYIACHRYLYAVASPHE